MCAALCHDTDASFTYLPCPAVDQIADCFFGVRVDPMPLCATAAAVAPAPDTTMTTAVDDNATAVAAVATATITATATATSSGDSVAAPVAASVHPLLKKPRQFSIDASPHLLYARGAFVDLLVRCSVSKYVEFRTLDATYLWLQDQFHRVRCGRWRWLCHCALVCVWRCSGVCTSLFALFVCIVWGFDPLTLRP